MSDKKPNRKRRGRGEGGVYQRDSDGLWVATASAGYDHEGKRVRLVAYGKTKREALEKLAAKKDAGPQATGQGADTLAAYLDGWLANIKDAVAPRTLVNRADAVRLFLKPKLGGRKLAELSAADVQGMYDALARDGVTNYMRGRAGAILSLALQPAVDSHVLPFNPARVVKRPRHRAREMTAFTVEQAKAFLLEAKKSPLHALYMLLLDSGCRPGEAFALHWPEVAADGSTVRLIRSLERKPDAPRFRPIKTAKGRRQTALTPATAAALVAHREAAVKAGRYGDGTGLVFCTRKGTPFSDGHVRTRSFRPILAAAGLPCIRPYDLRHSCATLLLAAGVDIKVVAERLGHARTVLAQNTYQHVLPGMQEAASAKLSVLLGGE